MAVKSCQTKTELTRFRDSEIGRLMIMTSNALKLFLCSGLIGLTLGCSADSGLGTLTGTVTLDGEPLKSGVIRFAPTDGHTATADAVIQDGKIRASWAGAFPRP